MNGWLIFGGIVLLLILLFAQSVTVTATYEEKLDVKVKFLFFTIYPTKPKKKKSPKKRKKNNAVRKAEARETDGERELSDESPEEAEAPPGENAEAPKDAGSRGKSAKKMHKKEKKEKKGLGLTFAEIMEYVRSASPPLKRLFKKIRCRDLTVDYTVATDDAAKTAIKYGAVCAAIYPVIEWLTTYFSVWVRRIHVEADFSKKEDLVYAYCKIKLRVSTALGCILWLGVRVVKTYFKIKNPKEVQA